MSCLDASSRRFFSRSFLTMFTASQYAVLKLVVAISCSLTLSSFFFFLLLFWKFGYWQHFHMRVIVWLTSSCAFNALVSLVASQTVDHVQDRDFLCQAVASILQFSALGIFFWSSIFAFILYRAISHLSEHNPVSSLGGEILLHLFSWGPSLLIVLFCLATDQFGVAGLWCWIQNSFWRFICFYIPLVISLLFSLVLFILTSRILWRRYRYGTTLEDLGSTLYDDGSDTPSNLGLKYARHEIQSSFACVVVVQLISWLPAVANRTQQLLQPHHQNFALAFTQALFSPLQGFLTVVTLCWLTSSFRRNVRELWRGTTGTESSFVLEPDVNRPIRPLHPHEQQALNAYGVDYDTAGSLLEEDTFEQDILYA